MADDQPGIRKRVCLTLASLVDLDVCDEAANGLEAVEKVREAVPDLVILDVTMPLMNGLDAARRIHAFTPTTPILILTMHKSRQLMEEAQKDWRAGLRGKGRGGAESGVSRDRPHAAPDVLPHRF